MELFLALLFYIVTPAFLVMGGIATAVAVARKGKAQLPEAAIAFYCLFAIGFSYLANFVVHVFFGDLSARLIGWENSPFQAEVGWASLGFALVGFLAYRRGFEMRLAAVVGPACFLLGAAVGHIYQIVTVHNYAPGNAGLILWMDIIVPVLGALLLWWRYRKERRASVKRA